MTLGDVIKHKNNDDIHCISKSNQILQNYKSNYSMINYFIRDGKPTGFHNLPVNVLMTIFMYLNEDTLRTKVIQTCHKWRQVALLPIFWRALKFQGLQIPQSYICQQLRSLSNLQCIYLVNIPNAVPIIRQLCRCNTRIIKVAIKNCKNNEEENRFPERVLRNMVASCRQLQEINLKGTPFYGNLFYLEVAVLPELKSINLSNNEYLNRKNIYELVLNSNLEEIKLSQTYKDQKLGDHDVCIIFHKLQSTLKSISMDALYLSDISFDRLFKCEKLQRLYLYNATNLLPNTFVKMKCLEDLEQLKIHNTRIPSQYFVKLFNPENFTFRRLKSVDFAGALKLTTEGLEAIVNCCTKLERVSLKCCKNLENINCLCTNCQNLSYVNIAFCHKISNDNILQVLEKLSNLEILFVDYTRLADLKKFEMHRFEKLSVFIAQSEYNKQVQPFKLQ